MPTIFMHLLIFPMLSNCELWNVASFIFLSHMIIFRIIFIFILEFLQVFHFLPHLCHKFKFLNKKQIFTYR